MRMPSAGRSRRPFAASKDLIMTGGNQTGLASLSSRIEIQCGSNPDDVSPRVTVALRAYRDQRGEMAEETRSQVDPLNTELMPASISRGTGGISRRSGFEGYVDGPAVLASIPPPTALREACLNGFPRALPGVLPPPPSRRPPGLVGHPTPIASYSTFL